MGPLLAAGAQIGGNILGGLASSSANKKAAKQYAAAIRQGIDTITTGRDNALGYLTPTWQRGQWGQDGYFQMLGLEDPGNTQIALPNYGAEPDYGNLDVGIDKYQKSPGYDFQQNEARKAVASAYGQRGLFMSGAAAKGLQDRAQGIADSDYDDWRDYTTGQYNTDRTFKASRYDANAQRQNALFSAAVGERDNLASRYDTRIDDLYRAGNWGNGGRDISDLYTTTSNAIAGLYKDQGATTASATSTNGQTWGNVLGQVGGQIGSYFRGRA